MACFLVCKMGIITIPTRLNELMKVSGTWGLYLCLLLVLLHYITLLPLTGPSLFLAAEERRFSPSGEWKAGLRLLFPEFLWRWASGAS